MVWPKWRRVSACARAAMGSMNSAAAGESSAASVSSSGDSAPRAERTSDAVKGLFSHGVGSNQSGNFEFIRM